MGTSINFANIFTNPNYQGQSRYITRPGWYIINSEFTGFDNNISSLTTSILNNVRVILFSNQNFDGIEYVVENDLPQLPVSMDNKCSSMIVELKTQKHVELFEHADFGGATKVLYGLSYPRLRDFFPNDTLSSIKVPFGTEVHLYEHENSQGKRIIIDKDTSFIGSDINDRISSMAIFNFPVAYSDPNFTGRSEVLEFADQYTADSQPPGSRMLKIGNDAIRSLKVSYPLCVKAYEGKKYTGEYKVYYHDIENIAGGISSLQVLPSFPLFIGLPWPI